MLAHKILNLNIFNSIILAGVIQGLVFGLVVVLSKRYRESTNLYLAGLIVVYSLSNLQYFLLDAGLVDQATFYGVYFIQWALLMPALLLFYGRCLLDKPLSRRWILIYLVPFLIAFFLQSGYKVTYALGRETKMLNEIFNAILMLSEYGAILFNLAVLLYLMYQVYKRNKRNLVSIRNISDSLQWFGTTLLLIFVATILWAYLESSFEGGSGYDLYYPLWIFIAVLIYWLGHIGIYKFGIKQERTKIRKAVFDRYSVSKVLPGTNQHISEMEKYLKVERNFLNPEVSLELIADHINLSPGHLSKVINTELGMSFKDYLNNLRVEEAKRYLRDPEFSSYTMVAIGLEAGFNSKSAFNSSFKRITGQTPSEFRKKGL